MTQRSPLDVSRYRRPTTSRNALMGKYGNLQAFCKLQKPLAKYLAAMAQRRSGVRIPSAPLWRERLKVIARK